MVHTVVRELEGHLRVTVDVIQYSPGQEYRRILYSCGTRPHRTRRTLEYDSRRQLSTWLGYSMLQYTYDSLGGRPRIGGCSNEMIIGSES